MNNIYINKHITDFPLRILLTFLVFTEVLFFFGPIDYYIPVPWTLIVFFFVVNITFYIGYKRGIHKYSFDYAVATNLCSLRFLHIFILASLVLIPLRISSLWAVSSLSPVAVGSHIINSIVNPGAVYADKLDLNSGAATYLCIIFSPVVYIALSLIVFLWDRLHGIWKFLASFLLLWELLLPIGQGVRKGIIDIGIIVIFLFIARKPTILIDLKKQKSYLLLIILFVASFIYYFIYSNLARYGIEDASILVENSTLFNIKDSYRYSSDPIFLAVVCSIESYLCQGYYALGNALCSDFTFSYGVGSSWFGVNMMTRLGIDVLPYTYVGQLERIGIDPTINWHSIYTWLASDYTFWGVPIFTYFMGNFLSITWLDTLTRRNVMAPSLFILFALMTFYSFANNQVFSLSFVAFTCIFLVWIFTRNKRVK